jgi:hypothetical protein
MLFTTKQKKEIDNDNRGGEVRRDDLRAPAVDANIMQIEMTDTKMQLDKFLLIYDR